MHTITRTIHLFNLKKSNIVSLAAVKGCSYTLQFLPLDTFSFEFALELCAIAVKGNYRVFDDIPEKFKTKELCQLAVECESKLLTPIL
jgi:hypothetical protein